MARRDDGDGLNGAHDVEYILAGFGLFAGHARQPPSTSGAVPAGAPPVGAPAPVVSSPVGGRLERVGGLVVPIQRDGYVDSRDIEALRNQSSATRARAPTSFMALRARRRQ